MAETFARWRGAAPEDRCAIQRSPTHPLHLPGIPGTSASVCADILRPAGGLLARSKLEQILRPCDHSRICGLLPRANQQLRQTSATGTSLANLYAGCGPAG